MILCFISGLFFIRITNREFKIPPKGKSVYIIRPSFVCDRFINISVDILFSYYHIKDIHFQPRCLLPLLPLGCSSGIVIDVSSSSTFIYPILFGVCDLFHSLSLFSFFFLSLVLNIGLNRIEQCMTRVPDDEERSIVDAVLQVIRDIPSNCKRPALSTILVYDNQNDTTMNSLQECLVEELAKRLQPQPYVKFLSSPSLVFEHLFWRGYCVCNECNIKEEKITEAECKEGKQWKDPLVECQ